MQDKLWAPWRIRYVQGRKVNGCFLCAAAKGKAEKHRVVFTTAHSLCILNIYPYNNGHLMVAPLGHVRELSKLNDVQLLDLWHSVEAARKLLVETLKPEGFNIGINTSAVAGAGIPGHMHVHIVPRWKGDTNFMPAVAGIKVISQSLEQLHKLLIDAYTKTNRKSRR